MKLQEDRVQARGCPLSGIQGYLAAVVCQVSRPAEGRESGTHRADGSGCADWSAYRGRAGKPQKVWIPTIPGQTVVQAESLAWYIR